MGAGSCEESSSISVWLNLLSGGCSCSGAGATSSDSVVCVGGEPMELEELDRLLSGAVVDISVQVVFSSSGVSLLSSEGLMTSKI